MLKFRIKNLSKIKEKPCNKDNTEVLNDLRFVVFEYLIPTPIFPSVRRVSKVYCLDKNASVGYLGTKYNLFNIATCWIGLPHGPGMMIDAFRKNVQGIDITREMVDKITLDDVLKGKLRLSELESEFTPLYKSLIKTLETRLIEYRIEFNDIPAPKACYIKNKGKHAFVLGFESLEKVDQVEMNKLLEKDFVKSTNYYYIDLSENTDLTQRIKNEGVQLNITD